MELLRKIHNIFVLKRRERVIANSLLAIIPNTTRSLLDIGCGDGTISDYISKALPSLNIEGVEVLVRTDCKIKCRAFDGNKLPFDDNSFDAVMMIDVLHHIDNIEDALIEAMRVSRDTVIIKDHMWSNRVDFLVLCFMDWVGNRAYNVRLPYNYQKKEFWNKVFEKHYLHIKVWKEQIGLYPFPFNFVFEKGKHFIVQLSKHR